MAPDDLARQLAALQAELVAIKAESTAKVSSLEETIGHLAHENELLKRRLFGNKTERSRTSELQLALGGLLAGEAELQRELDDAVGKVQDAVDPDPKPAKGARPAPKGRRAILFAYAEHHTSEFVQGLFGNFRGYLQADASNVYDILEHGPPKDREDGVRLVGCFAHCRRY